MSEDDKELSKLKATYYRGLVRVPLRALNFHHKLVQQKHRVVLAKNVRRIHKIYQKSGCLRLQEENFINGVIDDDALNDALALSRASRERLVGLREGDDILLLNLRNVQCLSGLHRVEAAKSFLDDNDQWWVVRLFGRGKCPHCSHLIENNQLSYA